MVPLKVWIQVFVRFLEVMFGAQHTLSSSEGEWQRGATKGRYFIYFTIDAATAVKAKAALEKAGVLCHEVLDGPQQFSDRP